MGREGTLCVLIRVGDLRTTAAYTNREQASEGGGPTPSRSDGRTNKYFFSVWFFVRQAALKNGQFVNVTQRSTGGRMGARNDAKDLPLPPLRHLLNLACGPWLEIHLVRLRLM